MKRKISIVGILVSIALITIISSVSASSESDQISKGFDAIKEKIDHLKMEKAGNSVVAEINGASIDKEQFTFYKSNLELTYSLQDKGPIPNDKELVNNLLAEKLVVQQAINQGITVSDEEVKKAIDYQRNIYETFEPADKDQALALELMKNRIRISGLTDDEFWNSDFVKEGYKESILGGKLMMKLISDGTVKDPEGFNAYKQELLTKVYNKVSYTGIK